MRLSDSPAFGALAERDITLDGVRIRYTEAGEGPPLLLLHGAIFSGNAFWWETQAALAPGVRTLAPDFPGWGASEKPRTPYTMEFYHRFIEAFLDALGLERVAIAGHSMGGLLASSFALNHPDRVAGLATVGVPPAWVPVDIPQMFRPFLMPGLGEMMLFLNPMLGIRHPLGIWRYYGSIFHDLSRISGERLSEILTDGCQMTTDPSHCWAFLSTLRANRPLFSQAGSEQWASRLADVTFPITMISGQEDPLFPVELVERAAARHPAARLEILDACGHFPMWEQPSAVNSLLVDLAQAAIPVPEENAVGTHE